MLRAGAAGAGVVAATVAAQPPSTDPGPNDMFPRWSHDGARIVFTSDRDGDSEIYVMAADGSDPVRLTHTPGRDAHPYFSRDGSRIVFQSPRANGRDTNLWVMRSDGSEPKRLADLEGFAGMPVWSPDETRIAFQWRASSDFASDEKWRICVMSSDGGDLRRITPGLANDQVTRRCPYCVCVASQGQYRPLLDRGERPRFAPIDPRRCGRARPGVVTRRGADRVLVRSRWAAARSTSWAPTALAW